MIRVKPFQEILEFQRSKRNLRERESLKSEIRVPEVKTRESYKCSGLVKSPEVFRLSPMKANVLLSKWHYLGPVQMIIAAYGHEEGCVAFGNCRSRIYEKKAESLGYKVIELVRMVGKDGHKWSMSSLISQSIKLLKEDYPNLDWIVTYSDSRVGHQGCVYTSSGFIFDRVVSVRPFFLVDGILRSPKALYDAFHTSSWPKIKEILGDRAELVNMPDKKRFVRYLSKRARKAQAHLKIVKEEE